MKKKIKTRILRAFLSVSVSSMVLAGLAAGLTMLNLRNAAIGTNEIIGKSAAENSEKALTEQAVFNMRELSDAKAQLIDSVLSDTAGTLNEISIYIDYLYRHKDEFKEISYPYVKDVPAGQLSMHWVMAEDIPFESLQDEVYLHGSMKPLYEAAVKVNPNISTIYFTAESGFATAYDAAAGYKPGFYDGRGSDWYVKAKESGTLYISEAYQDTFGRGLTITMSIPCFADSRFVGVIALDILIEELNRDIQETKILDDGFAMLIGDGQKVVSAPELTEENQNAPEYFLGEKYADIINRMKSEASGAEITVQNGEKFYAVWASIDITNWNYVLLAPYESMIEAAVQNSTEIESLSLEKAQEMNRQILVGTLAFIALFCVIISVVIYITMKVSQNITKPISALNDEVKQLGNGSFDYTSNITTGDEIEELSLSFESMTAELKSYIENLSKVTAEKERIGAELDVATKIQASMLPSIFPPFPGRSEFDIYASMQPAKEVGGDFYDFFLIDENTLAVVIADVSGKGVPAALFMVIAKTLIKNNAQYGKSPKEVFEVVNNILCENNDAGMFVTVFMGYLDIITGKFTYVNAGHNPPLLCDGEKFTWLQSKPGFVLAGLEDMFYKQYEIILKPGNELLLYTDGVTEAVNNENVLFGDPRLMETVNRLIDLPLKEFTVSIKREINKFAEGAEQSDDITTLTLRYKGAQTK